MQQNLPTLAYENLLHNSAEFKPDGVFLDVNTRDDYAATYIALLFQTRRLDPSLIELICTRKYQPQLERTWIGVARLLAKDTAALKCFFDLMLAPPRDPSNLHEALFFSKLLNEAKGSHHNALRTEYLDLEGLASKKKNQKTKVVVLSVLTGLTLLLAIDYFREIMRIHRGTTIPTKAALKSLSDSGKIPFAEAAQAMLRKSLEDKLKFATAQSRYDGCLTAAFTCSSVGTTFAMKQCLSTDQSDNIKQAFSIIQSSYSAEIILKLETILKSSTPSESCWQSYLCCVLEAEQTLGEGGCAPMPLPLPMIEAEETKMLESEIDDQEFNADLWRIHLARKSGRGDTHHVFILLEGAEGAARFLWYADLVHAGDGRTAIIRQHRADSAIACRVGTGGARATLARFIYAIPAEMNRLAGVDLRARSWTISPFKARQLLRTIQAEYDAFQAASTHGGPAPFRYTITGPSLSAAASSSTGQNCYTWARNHLTKLGTPFETDPDLAIGMMDVFFAAQPKKHIPDPASESTVWYRSPLVITAAAVVGMGFAIKSGRGCIMQ